MGANIYIGNAPNFMVRSIAEEQGVPMPSFFGYMVWSVGILCPIFALITWTDLLGVGALALSEQVAHLLLGDLIGEVKVADRGSLPLPHRCTGGEVVVAELIGASMCIFLSVGLMDSVVHIFHLKPYHFVVIKLIPR